MCTDELKRRLPIDFKGVSVLVQSSKAPKEAAILAAIADTLQVIVKVVDKEGIRETEVDNNKVVKSA